MVVGNLRTVIVDDNPSIRALVRQFLGLAGHEVVAEGGDGAAAIEHVRTYRPDAMIIDWQMPVMDGVEAVRRIRTEVGDDVAIVMFSSRGGSDAEPVARAAGVDAYVDKITDLDVLVATVESVASAHHRPSTPIAS